MTMQKVFFLSLFSQKQMKINIYVWKNTTCVLLEFGEIMLVVHKYGGSSVATTQKIMAIARHLVSLADEGADLVVVVSAMGKTTNELIDQAKTITKAPQKRELDALMSTGEQQAAALLSIAINSLGGRAISLNGGQAGFLTDSNHTHAFIKKIDVSRIKKHIRNREIVIVTGFQGVDEAGDITTFGRGGSDTTATALAAALGCACEIYTDVEGIFTLDPNVFPSSKILHEISYFEMMEMAVSGARVLEARSVELACVNKVPLYLGKALERDKTKGTWIMENVFEQMPISCIAQKDGFNAIVITLSRFDKKYWSRVYKLCENLDSYEMLSSIISGEKAIFSFGVADGGLEDVKQKIQDELGQSIGALIRDGVVEIHGGLSRLTLVGVGLCSHTTLVGEVSDILIDNNIEYGFVANSEISLSLTVDQKDKMRAMEILAKKFNL